MSLISFNSEQKLIENQIRKFTQAELEPISSEVDKNDVFPVEIIKKLSDLGFSSLIIPEVYGGAALDTTSLCIVLEELSKSCASVGLILAVNNCLVAFPIIKYATEEKKKDYLSKLSQGQIGAYITPPDLDESIKKLNTEKTDNAYIIKGKRDFVLNGEGANIFIMPLSVSNGNLLYIFEKNDIMFTKQNILGLKAAGIGSLEFKGFELTEELCSGLSEKADRIFKELRAYSNIGFAAVALGISEAAYDASVKYSKERRQFKRAICEFPMVQEMLVHMKTKIDAGRLLVYEAAKKYDMDQDYALSAHIARLHITETAVSSGIEAVQIYGGYGYTKDYPVERYLRDAKSLQLLAETPYDLKSTIVKELLQ